MEDPDQTDCSYQKQSDLGLGCLFRPFWQAISIQNFYNIYLSLKIEILYYEFIVYNFQSANNKSPDQTEGCTG